MAADEPAGVQEPPRTLGGILRRIGPGLVLAGTLVGSGELIATTRTGAEAGFVLLWLIILGCVIKVFVQVELGRHTISTGKTALEALNGVPGPVFSFQATRGGKRIGANWIVWCWLAMFVANIFLFSGIIGGLGQALALTAPLSEQGRAFNEVRDIVVEKKVLLSQVKQLERTKTAEPNQLAKLKSESLKLDDKLKSNTAIKTVPLADGQKFDPTKYAGWVIAEDIFTPDGSNLLAKAAAPVGGVDWTNVKAADNPRMVQRPHDDKYWVLGITAVTIVMLWVGRYRFIEVFALVLVGSFTVVTIVNLVILQGHESWAFSMGEILNGLDFSLPETVGDKAPLVTALATFGIIGVGAADQVLYPYWCQEKGYAKWTGPHADSKAWRERARGWMRVLQWDAWASCVLYTFTTIAFYLLGAAILGRIGLAPEGTEMIRTLSVMYVPVFGEWAQLLFLFGAFAVLFSTFFIGSAGHCRTGADVMRVMNLVDDSETTHQRWLKFFAVAFPVAATTVSLTVGSPVVLILIGGVAQAILLPMIAFGALHFRYKESDPGLAPGRAWDVALWVCLAVFLIIGGYLAYYKLA